MSSAAYLPELRTELLIRAEHDQTARRALGDPPTSDQWAAVHAVDAENAPWLEAVIAEHGWPGIDLVGEDGSHAAWLLAQHAPQHLQQRWLSLMQTAAEHGQASAADLAYLDDRVRYREHRGQRYGTQWLVRDGQQRLFPLEDPDCINDRRRAVGLPPLRSEDIANAWPDYRALNSPGGIA